MTLIGEICAHTAPVPPTELGQVVYQRFQDDPDLLAVAVVDEAGAVQGLIERNAFFLKMAAEYGRALFARRPVSFVMNAAPLTVEADTPVERFTGEALSTRASELFRGFVCVRKGRYVGVGSVLALLQQVTDENARRAHELEALTRTLRAAKRSAQIAHMQVRRAIDAMPEGVAFFDAEDRFLLWNKRYEALHGESSDLLRPGLPIRALLEHGLARGQYADAVGREVEWLRARLDRLRQLRSSEEQALPDGRWIRIQEERNEHGRISVAVDITELKRRELVLERTQSFLDTVVDSVPAMLIVKEPEEGRYVLVNRAGEALLGRSRDELLGKNDHDLFPADEADFFVKCDREAWESGDGLVIEEEPLTTSTGKVRYLQTRKRVMHGAAGDAGHLLVVCEDITERKSAAEALTAALEAARSADTAKSAFLANMSHEIRTPLNGVLGLASVLSKAPLAPEHKKAAATIAASASVLERLLSDVLDVARIESGMLEVRPEPFSLEALVERCADLFQARAHEKGLSFNVEVAQAAGGAYLADPVRLEQVLNNLLSNAIKFTPRGEVRLTVERDGGEHVFTVRDTGIGFDAQAHASLFERFTQADGSITRRFGGSGLGLAIARDLASRMGGDLNAVSEPGRGSAFTLRLPLAAALLDGDRAEDHESLDGETLHVLVADDHPVNLEVVRLILESAGVEVTLVQDGAQALEAFKAAHYDAALIDLQMPVIDGLTAMRAMRAYERENARARTPILALTANVLPEHRAASQAAGADGHLAKPIVADQLLSALQDALAPAEPEPARAYA